MTVMPVEDPVFSGDQTRNDRRATYAVLPIAIHSGRRESRKYIVNRPLLGRYFIRSSKV